MASRTPPERTSGRHHALSFASGATARAVATSAHPLPSSSARARTTDTLARARSPATSSSHTTRRSSGSTSVTETSSRAIASTNPGRPAPDPTSTTLAAGGSSGATAAQLRTCRVQSRGTSRGPRSPRSTAEVRRCSAKASARSLRGPNQASMAAGGGGAPSAPGGPVPSAADAVVTASVNRLDDHTTSRLDAFGLASEPGLRDHVVHDLPLEGVHRLEPHGLTGPPDLGDGPGCDVLQRPSAAGTIAGDVEHEAATLAGPRLYGEAGQLLQRLQDLSVGADQLAQLTVRTPLAEDRDRGAPVLHVDVDVSVEVSDVEQLLEVVGRHLALLLEALQRRPAPRPLGLAGDGLLLGLVSGSRRRDPPTLLLVVPMGRCVRLGHDAPLANDATPPPSVGVTGRVDADGVNDCYPGGCCPRPAASRRQAQGPGCYHASPGSGASAAGAGRPAGPRGPPPPCRTPPPGARPASPAVRPSHADAPAAPSPRRTPGQASAGSRRTAGPWTRCWSSASRSARRSGS